MQKEDMLIVSCQGYMMLGKKKIEERSPICFIQSVCVCILKNGLSLGAREAVDHRMQVSSVAVFQTLCWLQKESLSSLKISAKFSSRLKT